MNYNYLLSIILLSGIWGCHQPSAKPKTSEIINNLYTMYIGTYTRSEGHVDGKAKGISYLEVDTNNERIISKKTLAEIVNPSFLVTTKDNQFLYAVSELAQEGENTGFLYAYKILNGDQLELINSYPTHGRAPCHVSLGKNEKLLFTANYLDGKATVFLRNKDGDLEESQILSFEGNSITDRQEAPHLHSIQVSPDNSKAFIADLGSDKIWIYNIDSSLRLQPSSQPFIPLRAGSGPRHLAMASDEHIYVINELNSTVSFISNQSGIYEVIDNYATLPPDFTRANSCADLRLHPAGKFLYGSNRGHDSIVAYKIEQNGILTVIGHFPTMGKVPRNFNITSDGNYLIVANQNSDNLVFYSINPIDGLLSFAFEIDEVMTPVCIEF